MTWNTLGSMTTHRHGLGVVVLEGPLYAVGGHDGRTFFPFFPNENEFAIQPNTQNGKFD